MNLQSQDQFGFNLILWDFVLSAWLAFMLMFGGVSNPSTLVQVVQSVSSAGIIVMSAWLLRHGFPTKLAALGAGLAILGFVLVLLQTIPLPYAIWSTLPGRQLFIDSFTAIGVAQNSMPLSLAPDATRGMAVAMLPALASYLSILTLRSESYGRLALVIVICALIGLFIGLIQRSLGEVSGLYFYGYKGFKTATGTFGNRNFFATQLFTTIPFIAALAAVFMQRQTLRPWLVATFALFYMALLVAGLAVVGSRAGIALAIASVFMSILYVFRPPVTGAVSNTRWSLYGVIFAAVIIVQVGMVSIMRFAATDPLDDFRSSISAVTMEATKTYFPYGSGFGTFVPIYQIFEQPEVIIDSYVNHAHNDWLELALEGGLPAIFLMAGFVLLFGVATSMVSRLPLSNGHNFYLRAGVVVIILMSLHAIVDFGLRTPALMVLFAACCGLIVTANARRRPANATHTKQKDDTPIRPPESPQFVKTRPYFGSNKSPERRDSRGNPS